MPSENDTLLRGTWVGVGGGECLPSPPISQPPPPVTVLQTLVFIVYLGSEVCIWLF